MNQDHPLLGIEDTHEDIARRLRSLADEIEQGKIFATAVRVSGDGELMLTFRRASPQEGPDQG